MKKNLLALSVAVAVASASFAANAAVEDTWVIGARTGWAYSFFDDGSHSFNGKDVKIEDSENNAWGLGLYGEYNINQNFGVGLGYNYITGFEAKGSADGFSAKSDYDEHIVELYGRLALPLDAYGSDVFLKAGATYNYAAIDRVKDKDSFGAVFGIGAQYAFNNNLAVRAGYDYYLNTINDYGVNADTGLLYLGVQYTFGAEPAPVVAPQAPEKKTVRVTENHSLEAGMLFPFDGSTLSAEGKQAVDSIADSAKNLDNTEISVYGYTDRIGSDAYNQKLSQKRAQVVADELSNNGLGSQIKAVEGRGKASPVTGNKCDTVKGKQNLINCLSPDRRVEVQVTGDTSKVEEQ